MILSVGSNFVDYRHSSHSCPLGTSVLCWTICIVHDWQGSLICRSSSLSFMGLRGLCSSIGCLPAFGLAYRCFYCCTGLLLPSIEFCCGKSHSWEIWCRFFSLLCSFQRRKYSRHLAPTLLATAAPPRVKLAIQRLLVEPQSRVSISFLVTNFTSIPLLSQWSTYFCCSKGLDSIPNEHYKSYWRCGRFPSILKLP